jgi:hypothetical protein
MSKTFRKHELENVRGRFDRGLMRLGRIGWDEDQKNPVYDHVYKVRRLMGRHDEVRINTVVRAALQNTENSEEASFEKARRLGVSIATPSCLRKIYVGHYHDPEYGSLMHGRFNRKIERYVESINTANRFLFPQLGEIGIFGATKDQDGPRFVGPVLIGDDLPQIQIEAKGLLYRLSDKEEWHQQAYGNDAQPHVTLVRTNSFEKAEEIQAALTTPDLNGIYVQLLPAVVSRSSPS